MKRLFIIFSLLLALACMGNVTTLHQMVVARKNVAGAGVPTIFTEDFDAPGWENTWVLSNDPAGGLESSNTTTKITGGYSLYVDGDRVSGTNHYAYIDLGAGGPTNFFVRVYMMGIDDGSANEDSWLNFHDGATAAPANRACGSVYLDDTADVDVSFASLGGFGTYALVTPDVWHLMEFHYPSMNYKVDGGTIVTNINADTTPTALRSICVGDASGALDDGNVRWDALAISTVDWIGPVP